MTTTNLSPNDFKAVITKEMTHEVTARLTHEAVTHSFFSGNGCYMFEDALAKLTNDFITRNDNLRNLEVQHHFFDGKDIHYYIISEDNDLYYGFRIDRTCGYVYVVYSTLGKDYDRNDILLHPCTLGEIFDAWEC